MRHCEMKVFLILLNVTCLCRVVSTKSDVRLPPDFDRSSTPKSIVYRAGKNIILEFRATGSPDVRFEWKKNGFDLNTTDKLTHIIIKDSGGTTIFGLFSRPTEKDEGYYQCLAKNQYGTALSRTTDVKMAVFENLQPLSVVIQKTVVEGMPFHIQGDRSKCFPSCTYHWYVSANVTGTVQNNGLVLSNRIQLDDNEDLHFAYTLLEDSLGGAIYRCSRYNDFLGQSATGCNTQLTVDRNPEGNISQSAPALAFSSEAEIIAFIGETKTLRCFFYGYPVPNISWIGPTNLFSTGRFSMIKFETRLQIHNITSLDEGEYNCTGTNAEGNSTHTIQLRVEAVPMFNSTKDGPYNVNLTEGESVTFNCNPFAIPEANIVWLQNGQPIDTERPPRRFTFSKTKRSLTIRNVCRDCVDSERKTDLMVIQCNASNVHGYAFAQGYLNVLLTTTVTIKGKAEASVDLLRNKELVFHCHVTSDPSTPRNVRWFKTEPVDDLVRDDHPYIWVENEFLVIVFSPNCAPNCTEYLGEYRCLGDNRYSGQNRTIKVSYTSRLAPENFRQFGDMLMSWEMILGAGGITLVLFLFGIFLGFLSNRRSEKVKRRMKNRKVPNPPSMRRRIEYDSDSIPLEEIGNEERLIDRESSVYEYIDYATFRDMLEEKGRRARTMSQRARAMSNPSYSINESIDPPQKEEVPIRFRPRIDEDDMYDDTRCSSTLEEEAINDGKIKQQEKFQNSNERSEAIANNSDLRRKEIHSYLELIPTEGHPYSDLRSKAVDRNPESDEKEAIPYMNMEKKEVSPYLDMDGKEMKHCSDEDNAYLDMDKKKSEFPFN